jgi:adenylate kinase family enzyme
MKRTLIIGGGGAGKTTLAKELHRRFELPSIHLNRPAWLCAFRVSLTT